MQASVGCVLHEPMIQLELGINNTNSRPQNLAQNSLELNLPSRFALRLPRSSLPWSNNNDCKLKVQIYANKISRYVT